MKHPKFPKEALHTIGSLNTNKKCVSYLNHTLNRAVSFAGDDLHTEIVGHKENLMEVYIGIVAMCSDEH